MSVGRVGLLATAFAAAACAAPGAAEDENTGVAQQDVLVSGTRDIVSNFSLSEETSAAWNLGSGCKNADSVVIAWHGSTNGWWVNNCSEGTMGFSTPQQATTTTWGTLPPDNLGQSPVSYGGDVTVLGIPGHSKQFAYLAIAQMTASGSDIVMATSEDSGGTFTVKNYINEDEGVFRPVMAADPSATDGTVYVAWLANLGTSIDFRKVNISTSGAITLGTIFTFNPMHASAPGPFTLAVQHGSPNTVWIAYADQMGATTSGDCSNLGKTVKWWAASTTNNGSTWNEQSSPIDTDTEWTWCAGGQTLIGYGNDTRPELNYAPGLNQLSAAYSKTEGGSILIQVSTFNPGGMGGSWTHQKPPGNPGQDEFRPTFASFPTNNTNQAFGLSWLQTDHMIPGNVTAQMATSTTGTINWNGPAQVSGGSWNFVDTPTGNYGGMAAVGPGGMGDGNDFWPTWIARNSGQDVVVTAEWSTP